MITPNDFLHNDLPLALKHHHCCMTCLFKTEEAYANGNYKLAEERMKDFNRSLQVIKMLAERKRRHDLKEEMLRRYREMHVDIKVVSINFDTKELLKSLEGVE